MIETRKGRERAIFPSSSTSFDAILGDPGADSGGEGKSKRAGKYGSKKRKEVLYGYQSVSNITETEKKNDTTVNLNCFKLFCFLLDHTNFLGRIDLVLLYPPV